MVLQRPKIPREVTHRVVAIHGCKHSGYVRDADSWGSFAVNRPNQTQGGIEMRPADGTLYTQGNRVYRVVGHWRTYVAFKAEYDNSAELLMYTVSEVDECMTKAAE